MSKGGVKWLVIGLLMCCAGFVVFGRRSGDRVDALKRAVVVAFSRYQADWGRYPVELDEFNLKYIRDNYEMPISFIP